MKANGVNMVDITSLSARRILVIAPHPDDESLGCGGLIALLACIGRTFHVVFVTDGGASHRRSKSWPRPRLARQRVQEATNALDCLGIGDHERTFLGLTDAAMPGLHTREGSAALSTLQAVIGQFNPDLVILPWRRDPHCDHRDAWSLTRRALSIAEHPVQTLEYTVWLDEIGEPCDHPLAGEAEKIGFDISAAIQKKRDAVSAHISQTTTLIDDDPHAFRLTAETIDRLTGPIEFYWRPTL